MHLSEQEKARYARHLSLPNFDESTQLRLKSAKVVCVGAGGLASGSLPYLVAAGIGHLTLIDHDCVELSNLQRQVLFTEEDIGQAKVQAAKRRLNALNAHVDIQTRQAKLAPDNALEYLTGFDLIIDGTDNFKSHYCLNDAAHALNTPLIMASVHQFKGQCFFFRGHNGCYRCLFETPPDPLNAPSCTEAGILGVVPGMLGLLEATLALQYLSGQLAESQFIACDFQSFTQKRYNLHANPDCTLCGGKQSFEQLYQEAPTNMSIPAINVTELKTWLDEGREIQLLDVREDYEREAFNIGGQHMPIQTLPETYFLLDKSKPVVVYCRSGGRSLMACEFLVKQGYDVTNLSGGMLSWQQTFSEAGA